MNAMIFAAGIGSRLRPLTDTRPKALIEVNGVPMIDRAINRLNAIGVDKIVVNVHHHAGMLIDYLKRYDNVVISDESQCLLDTGGGLLAAEKYFNPNSHIILYNADILTDLPLKPLLDCHVASGLMATLLIDRNRNSSRKLLFDSDNIMHGWINCTTNETLPENLVTDKLFAAAFGGIHVVSTEIFPRLHRFSAEHGKVFSITPFYVAASIGNNISGYLHNGEYQWFDIGSIKKLNKAKLSFKEPWPID